jgi:hypothetical protein
MSVLVKAVTIWLHVKALTMLQLACKGRDTKTTEFLFLFSKKKLGSRSGFEFCPGFGSGSGFE